MIKQEDIRKLEDAVKCDLDITGSTVRRSHNVRVFNDIPRTYNGQPLIALEQEAQILIAKSEYNEDLRYKIPGLESLRTGKYEFPLDARPIVVQTMNPNYSLKDMTIDAFINTFIVLINRYPELAEIILTIFMRITYLQFPLRKIATTMEIIKPHEKLAKDIKSSNKIAMTPLYHNHYTVEAVIPYEFNIYMADFPPEIWEILNKNISMTGTEFEDCSFELFVKYVDAVAQCEDNKMDYFGNNGLNNFSKKRRDINVGRINTIRSIPTTFAASKGFISADIQELIYRNASRKKGMRPIPLFAVQKLAPNLLNISEEDITADMRRYKTKNIKTSAFLPEGTYEFVYNKMPTIKAQIMIRGKDCILMSGSKIATDWNDISIAARQHKIIAKCDDTGVLLTDLHVKDATAPMMAQIICGKKMNNAINYFKPV